MSRVTCAVRICRVIVFIAAEMEKNDFIDGSPTSDLIPNVSHFQIA
jgi:hypothetical protein